MEPDSLPERVRCFRLRRGLSQERLAGAVGRDRTWVAHLERGALRPARWQVRALAWALGLPPGRLVRGLDWRPAEPVRMPSERVAARFARALPPPARPRRSGPPPSPRLGPLLEEVRCPRTRSGLAALALPDEETWVLALVLARRGGTPAWMAPARVGFPVPLAGRDGTSAAHLRRPCLLWEGPEGALVLFGPWRGGRPRALPPVLAASGPGWTRFLALGPGEDLPGLERADLAGLEEVRAEALLRGLLEGRPPG